MGNSESKLFLKLGQEVAKAAIKVLTEGEGAPNDQTKVRSFVSTVLQLPDTASEEDLERAITEIDPNDDISTNAERFIRAASIYVYSQRNGDGQCADFWLACRECLVKLGFGESVQNLCATPAGDEALDTFCRRLNGCTFNKSVDSAGMTFSLWTITKEALKVLENYLETLGEGEEQSQQATA